METPRKLRVSFCIHFKHYSLACHFRSSSCDFRSSHATRLAPFRPEVHEYGNRGVLNHFIKQRIVNSKRFREGRQRRLTDSATASAGQILGGNAVLLSAMAAGTGDRHSKP